MIHTRCSLRFAPALWLISLLWPPSAPAVQDDLVALEEQAIKAAVAKIAPSVLRIETIGGLERVERVLVGTGATTGLAVSPDGYIISSAFNFIQQPSSILVTLPSGRRATAQIVARDRSRMLVLLKVASDELLTVPQVVPREEMAVGQWTIAVGRTFDQPLPNVSVGILSATSRIWGKAIQTDAKVSPNNYGGPLIDIRGRVLGVLAPLSPQQQDEVAGAEWYDSGIGFAIPLVDVLRHLDKLKRGEELYPGLLGITLQGNDIYADPPEIAAVQPKSPARKAGLQAGDRIVEVAGIKIARQTQLRHALGPRYAGEQLNMVVLRGARRVEIVVELAGRLEPYETPFLGLLPDRSPAAKPGVVVRYVYPGSPAAKAGLRAEDRLVRLSDKPVADVASAWEILGNYEPKQRIKAAVQRAAETREFELELASLPTAIPQHLPAARRPVQASAAQRPPVGAVNVKLPEETNECFAYVPDNYHPEVAYGLLMWLHEPGDVDRAQLIETWKGVCQANDLILLVPQSADPQRWLPTESDYLRKTLDEVIAKYHIDRTRIVACGRQTGGAMALLTAFSHRSLIRAAAATDTVLPGRIQVPANDPIERLALMLTVAEKQPVGGQRIEEQVKRLQDMKYPIILRKRPGEPRPLDDQERAELVRWIDTLDRF
ncbi:MAG: PDZ domain-containing protein [Candidatus Anammoximicrobium sp.]|nr:PDZ domain-containing protein [Candidatus Anammoximicrobium sp.]